MTRPHILLVEDSEADVQLCRYAMEDADVHMELAVARDGEVALSRLLGRSQDPHEQDLPAMVLLDLKLPLVSGLEVLRRLRQHPGTRTLPVVVMTSSNQPRDIQEAYTAGANAFIVKPGDYDGYIELLRAVDAFWVRQNLSPRVIASPGPAP